MKKRLIVFGSIIAVAVVVLIAVMLKEKPNTEVTETASTTESEASTVAAANLQVGVVDSWLKIIGIDEYYGRLAVVVENVSERDVEYALVTVKTKSSTLTFDASYLLSGTKAVLLCNENVAVDPNEVYTAWGTDTVIYKDKSMYADKLEVCLMNGSISVKNISGEDIESDIYIYYKDKDGDLLNGSATGRTKVAGIKADSQTFIKTPEFNTNNCQIIFVEFVIYDDKEV